MRLAEIPISSLPRTHSVTIKRFAACGVQTYADLLSYFPSRYEDFSLISPIGKAQKGEKVTLRGVIEAATIIRTKFGKQIVQITISDETGKIPLMWFNQPYLLRNLTKGLFLAASGEIATFGNRVVMYPTSYEVLENEGALGVHTGRLVAIYPEKNGLSSKIIREKVAHVLATASDIEIPEMLPAELLTKFDLIPYASAVLAVHKASSLNDVALARRRLAFNELFIIQLASNLIRAAWEKKKVTKKFTVNSAYKSFLKNLPFTLTGAQTRVLSEIESDLTKTYPMNRFLQGDVGSGKTAVAAAAAYLAHQNGVKTLFMCPTEVLAEQHFATLLKLFAPYPEVTIGIQTKSKKVTPVKKKKDSDEMNAESENYSIIVGTQALITTGFEQGNVGLVIIDEQHRFGVRQRSLLKEKGGNPHLLTMTATPIPRTVALTLYGQLDVSVIDEMPVGRTPIKTWLVPSGKRTGAYDWIRQEILKHKTQVFVVCPLIEESEVEGESMQSVRAATKEFERLKTDIFPEFKLALLHGKLKAAEKQEIMHAFKAGEYDILISTTVVEVGIDVPNATIMLIEGAERFGLAQLHQLRGRVGRGSKESYCLLFTSNESQEGNTRLQFFSNTTSGMQLAEFDLKIRGAGELYGTAQSGVSELKIADFSDYALISATQQAVKEFQAKYKLSDFSALASAIEKREVARIAKD